MIARPRLAPTVTISRLRTGEEAYAIVKESEARKYFKFEDWEGDLLELLDGSRALDKLAAEFSRQHPLRTVDAQWVADYVEELRALGLMERTERERHLVMMDRLKVKRSFYDVERSTLFQIHIPLFDPDKLMDRVIPYIRWVWSPWFVAPWIVIFTVLLGFLLHHWDLYWSGFFELWNLPAKGFWDWVGFFALMFIVSIWHEFGHGFTCKRFGGEVHDIGFMIFYFQPAFYCGIDDSYLFPKRSHRMHCTFGGPYFELMMASVAALIWLTTPAELWIHRVALAVIFFTGLSVIVLNINPLIKLDGYYLLMDFLDVPDLREESFSYLGNVFKKHVLRLQVPKTPIPRRRRRIYLIYGIAAVGYTLLVLIVLVTFLRHWLVGQMGPSGYLLLIAIVGWLMRKRLLTLTRFLKHTWLDKRELLQSASGKVMAGAIVTVAIVLLALIPTATRVDGTFVVEPVLRDVVRPQVAGVVVRVAAREGDTVAAGQVLAVLEDPSLRAERERAAADRERALRQSAVARLNRDTARELQFAAAADEAMARGEIAARRERSMTLSSAIDGVVATPGLEHQTGRYLAAGDAYCAVDQLDSVRLVVSISQRDLEEIGPGMPLRAQVAALPFRTIREKVLTIAPAAEGDPETDAPKLDLVPGTGLLRVLVEVNNTDGLLKPGMTGRAQFLAKPRSVASKIAWHVRRWVESFVW